MRLYSRSVDSSFLVVSYGAMDSCPRTMQLDLADIERTLVIRKAELVKTASFLFNCTLLALMVCGFGYFLWVQYTTTKETQQAEKRIEFTPQVWYSATRNLRSEEYGRQLQPLEIETGFGIPRPVLGSGSEDF